MGALSTDKLAVAERDGSGPQQDFLAGAARQHRMIVVGGCVPIASTDQNRVRSACLVYGPDGNRLARYDKIHLFAFSDGEEHYDEARTIEPGERPDAFEAPCGRVGLSICYDLRFPELYRALGDLALVLVPAAFTVPTGKAHWELLLRARAVENQCYLLAAAQGGTHPNGRRTFGHSMLVDPWGDVLAQHVEGPGVVVGDVDTARIAEVRRKLPAYSHRVL
jgi:nitrilase